MSLVLLPTELLLQIINLIPSLVDRQCLRHASRRLYHTISSPPTRPSLIIISKSVFEENNITPTRELTSLKRLNRDYYAICTALRWRDEKVARVFEAPREFVEVVSNLRIASLDSGEVRSADPLAWGSPRALFPSDRSVC